MKEAEVVWILAHIGPATRREIAEFAGVPPREPPVVRVWRQGFTVRRKRKDSERTGRDPYEYVLKAPEGEEVVDDS